MIIHYENKHGEEKLLRNIIAMQNIDNEEWEAITEDNTTLHLFTDRIEMILDESIVDGEKESKTKAEKENKK